MSDKVIEFYTLPVRELRAPARVIRFPIPEVRRMWPEERREEDESMRESARLGEGLGKENPHAGT